MVAPLPAARTLVAPSADAPAAPIAAAPASLSRSLRVDFERSSALSTPNLLVARIKQLRGAATVPPPRASSVALATQCCRVSDDVLAQAPTANVFEAAGGEPAFRELVGRFYARVATDPVLRAIYPEADLSGATERDRKSTRLNSSHVAISYAVFCLKKKKRAASASLLLLPISPVP